MGREDMLDILENMISQAKNSDEKETLLYAEKLVGIDFDNMLADISSLDTIISNKCEPYVSLATVKKIIASYIKR